MQTELAQIISLTSFGNEVIKTGKTPENYFPYNTVFGNCGKVDFSEYKIISDTGTPAEITLAISPIDWFKILKDEKCKQLRLYYNPSEDRASWPEYMQVGFVGGGGSWLIETNFGNYSHYWHKRWEILNRNPKEGAVWGVHYFRVLENFSPANQQYDFKKNIPQFTKTINELINFCIQQKLTFWLETFQKADKILSDPTPNKQYYHFDLIVTKNYALEAQQLLFSAATAWVFGGMGSWNDMQFDDKAVQEKYKRLSGDLYKQIIQSIIATVNSF